MDGPPSARNPISYQREDAPHHPAIQFSHGSPVTGPPLRRPLVPWLCIACFTLALGKATAERPSIHHPLKDIEAAALQDQAGHFDIIDAAATSDDRPTPNEGPLEDTIPKYDSLSRIEHLETELRALKGQLESKESQESKEAASGIEIGGAVRLLYSLQDYDQGNRDRGGDIDFDVFRLDFDGVLGGVQLSAQYRWFQYMDVIHHAWFSYPHHDHWQCQAGITRVPFGNLPFNSHNFFFSSGFYVGLEDDYDAGVKLIGQDETQDFRLAFFVTDELGGIDGFVDNRADRYAYDVVGIRSPSEGIFYPPATEIAEHNSVSLRYVYKYPYADVGGSILYGDLRDRVGSVGDRLAYAVHLNSTINRWNFQLQFTDYYYEVDDGSELLVVAAYSFFDTIPSRARLYSVNVAYSLPVKCGPISKLTFYNDHNIMTDKSGGLTEDTRMNVTGVAVTTGGLYTYVDLITAKNQPFIGSSMAADDDDWNTRFSVNAGFYF